MGAVVHERESSQNWNGSLAQGDPWNLVSTHVPAGRGPFKSWEDAAVDALVNCHPFAARNMDWSIGGTLTMLEQYNGLGYSNLRIWPFRAAEGFTRLRRDPASLQRRHVDDRG